MHEVSKAEAAPKIDLSAKTCAVPPDESNSSPGLRGLAPQIVAGTFGHSSPYGGCWLEHFYRSRVPNLYGTKIRSERNFHELIDFKGGAPELWIEGNFTGARHGIKSMCDQWGINRISSEDGFFPHYSTLHADPLGFCWESSLCKMVFRQCADHQRQAARDARREWLTFDPQELPATLKRPYVLWPLQLLGDNVNRWDLGLSSWMEVMRHFRTSLPREFCLVIKHHPRSRPQDFHGVEELMQELPNCCLLERDVPLKSLLNECVAVAGVNSTVLTEARMMFSKPTYAYGRSWFSMHPQLVIPLNHRLPPQILPRIDRLVPGYLWSEWDKEYADWYLYQLLVRQTSHVSARDDWDQLRSFVDRLSYRSFQRYGEEVFA